MGIDLPEDAAISYYRYTCSTMFTAALLVIEIGNKPDVHQQMNG